MDKLAYHLNKKQQPAPTDCKFLYYYPADEEIANAHVGNKYYITVEVSEQEWENTHRDGSVGVHHHTYISAPQYSPSR